MRKKILALVLGLVLALSLYLPAGAAAQVSEDTVVQVVTAIGILNGDGSGDLNLSGNVTRAEFATMLVRASSLKDSTAAVSNVSPFKDVSYTHWAASYVKTAVQQGWMSGYLDGTYRPDQPITLEEAETAVLKMLGYTNSDFPGAFPYGQVSLAQSLKLDENVNVQMGENLTRRDCMYLMYNLGQFTRNYTQTVKRAADNKRRYAPGEGSIPPVLLSGVSKGVPPLAHDFACKV